MKKLASLLLTLVMIMTMGLCASAETVVELPRNETLYFAGQQWGTVNSWNVIGTNQNNAMAIAGNAGGYRTLMFETLYMFDFMDGSLRPLLADGDYAWNETMTELTVKIKDAAKWSDGAPLTAEDVKATLEIGVQIGNTTGSDYGAYISAIEPVDEKTLVIKAALREDGMAVNPLRVLDFLTGAPIAQKAWIDAVVARNNGDAVAILNDAGEDVVWSGPYTKLLRGRSEGCSRCATITTGARTPPCGAGSLFPSILAHAIYADNPAGENALKDWRGGRLPAVHRQRAEAVGGRRPADLHLSMKKPPYGVCLTMPTAYYNMNIPVLAENAALRKAIAIAVDYDSINANAMTVSESVSFSDRAALPDEPHRRRAGAVRSRRPWRICSGSGNDIEGAKELLDEAGLVDSDGDGWREWNGEKISLNACLPQRLDRLAGLDGSGRRRRREHRR